jgi:hypothetical protein
MPTIVLDAAAAESLRKCNEPAVLRDSAGNIVGYFQPRPRVYEPGEIPEFDEAELDRRVERWQGIPAEEVMRRLRERK